jgi:putative hydrolase of the HAD superfamily
MTHRAVMFDLYGTLVFDRFSSKKHLPFQSKQAARLGLSEAEFVSRWQSSYVDRLAGTFKTYQDNILWIGNDLGKKLDLVSVEEAANNMVEFTRLSLRLRLGALETLRALKERGFKIGLLSDCGPACPRIWKETSLSKWFDCATFSFEEKIKKPDLRFYRIALDRLGIPAEECLYLGDGHSQELVGAQQAGMDPALIMSAIDPEEPDRWVVKEWDGAALRSLPEILNLLK